MISSSYFTQWERERSWEHKKKTHMLLLRPLGQPWAYNKHLNVTPLKLTSAMIRKEGKEKKKSLRCCKVKNYTNINPGDCLNFTLRPAVTSRIISETWLLEEDPDISGTHTGLLVCTFLFILSSYVCWCRTFPQILVIKVYSCFFLLSPKIRWIPRPRMIPVPSEFPNSIIGYWTRSGWWWGGGRDKHNCCNADLTGTEPQVKLTTGFKNSGTQTQSH